MPSPPLPSEDLDHVLVHTRDLWEEFRGQRLFLTGGTGFFGKWLIETFLWANDRHKLQAQVLVLSRDPDTFCHAMPHLARHPALAFHAGDVRSFESPGGSFSHVIHAATPAVVPRTPADALEMFNVIVEGTRRVLDLAVGCGARKFLLTSSGAVYGLQPPELSRISEDFAAAPDPVDVHTAYGQGKRAAEHLSVLYSARYGLETKIARGFAFVGPHLPLEIHFAIGNFIRDALRGGPILIQGDGTPCRSYLYAADLAAWLWTILCTGRSCRPYNVGSDQPISIAELAEVVASCFDPPPSIQVAHAPLPGKLAPRYVPATKRASEELGLRPWIELREGIPRTRRWHHSQQ